MRGFRALLLTTALAAGLVLLAFVFHKQLPRLLAHYWQGQLSTADDERAGQLLGQIGGLGEVGIPVLVRGLGSTRECVARSARQVLDQRIDHWLTLPPDEVWPQLSALAEALAAEVGHFGPTARRDAEELATWILRWRPDGDAVDRADLIASCRKVLEVTDAYPQVPVDEDRLAANDFTAPGSGRRKMPPDLMRDSQTGAGPAIAELARLPGGGLSVDGSPASELPPLLLDPSGLVAAEATPATQAAPTRSALPETVALGPLRLSDSSAAAGLPSTAAADRPSAAEPMGGMRVAPSSVDAAMGSAQSDLVAVDTLELMRRLHDAGGDALARIRAELARRGFTEVHLALAVKLFDPDPRVRSQMARRLPELQSIDAVPWLLWLSEDASADVRLTAITLLVTTGDPALLRRVEQIARRDPDPRVRQHAQRIAQQRRRPLN